MGEGVPVRAADVADAWVDGFVADTLGDYGEVRVSDSADLARHVLRGLSEAAGGGGFAVVDGVLCRVVLVPHMAAEERHDDYGSMWLGSISNKQDEPCDLWPGQERLYVTRPVLGEASDG